MNHCFNAEGLYTHTLPEGRGRIPRNARRVALPPAPWDRLWPRWNGKSWELLEDHRARTGVHAQEPTLYRLPGDAEDAPARTMTRVGPLPEDALPCTGAAASEAAKDAEDPAESAEDAAKGREQTTGDRE